MQLDARLDPGQEYGYTRTDADHTPSITESVDNTPLVALARHCGNRCFDMRFEDAVEFAAKVIDAAGVIVVGGGSLLVLGWHGVRRLGGRGGLVAYRELRRDLGRVILLGLELLVAADIIRTVAATPTFAGVGILALIVLIRTFLSLALEVEVSGQLPWRRQEQSAIPPRRDDSPEASE